MDEDGDQGHGQHRKPVDVDEDPSFIVKTMTLNYHSKGILAKNVRVSGKLLC